MPVLSLTPAGWAETCHHTETRQKFKFLVDRDTWGEEDELCLSLPIDKTSWPLTMDVIITKEEDNARMLSISKHELGTCNEDHPMIENKSDRVIVDIQMLKNKEVKFEMMGKYYTEVDSDYKVKLPVQSQIDLFDEEGKFTMEVTVYVSSRKEELEKHAASTHENLMKDVLNHHETSDVKIISNEQEFKCHRNIISCRVPALAMMLRGETAENQTSTINIGDWNPESVQLMIEYLYTGVIPDAPARIEIDLLKLAVKYDLPLLAESCGSGVIKNLTVENFLPTYAELDIHGQEFPHFKEEALEFFKKNGGQIVKREDYLKFSRDFPVLTQELVISLIESLTM